MIVSHTFYKLTLHPKHILLCSHIMLVDTKQIDAFGGDRETAVCCLRSPPGQNVQIEFATMSRLIKSNHSSCVHLSK